MDTFHWREKKKKKKKRDKDIGRLERPEGLTLDYNGYFQDTIKTLLLSYNLENLFICYPSTAFCNGVRWGT